MSTNNLFRGTRLQIMLAPEELAAVDDFRFKNRMPSRASAVRELFRLGLTNAVTEAAASGQQSSSYGVLTENGKDNKTAKSPKTV
jgi:hypothetical protein